MKHIVGVGEIGVSQTSGDLLVTHALGSCLGIAVHDGLAGVGGLLHAMLPSASINREKARVQPAMFVDTGLAALLDAVLAAGAARRRLQIKVAGGAAMQQAADDRFAIGKRNYLMLKKVLWQHNLLLQAEDVGGEQPRTMYLEIGSGGVWLTTAGQSIAL